MRRAAAHWNKLQTEWNSASSDSSRLSGRRGTEMSNFHKLSRVDIRDNARGQEPLEASHSPSPTHCHPHSTPVPGSVRNSNWGLGSLGGPERGRD